MEQTESATIEKIDVAPPSKWKVIFKNDDITPMGFVVQVLNEVFQIDNDKAVLIMLEVHHKGSAVVGIYYKAIAETRQQTALEMAKKMGYPLQIVIEKE